MFYCSILHSSSSKSSQIRIWEKHIEIQSGVQEIEEFREK